MSTFATAVAAPISNGGIDMWRVNRIVASDEKGNYVVIENEKVVVSTLTSSGRVYRNFELKETPPCLSVAVNDLIKMLTDEEKTST